MSILETFYIMFKSDASEVKKGADEALKSTNKLESSLQSIGRSSETVGAKFLSIMRSAEGALGAFVSAGSLFAGFKSAIASVQELGDTSRALNVNVEALDAWGHAVQRTGGTAAGFQSSLQSFASHLNTTPAVALKSLLPLADALHKMNQGQANAYGKSLGLDQATIYLLQQGRREVEATINKQKDLGLVTQKDTEITRKFDNSIYDLGRAFQGFQREIVLPALPKLTAAFDYLIEHKDLIKGALIAISLGMSIFAASALLARPAILAVTAALTAFTLAYEDFQKFKVGAPSVTGEVVKKFNKDVKGTELLLQHIAPNFLNDENINSFSQKYFHLPKFLGGQGYGSTGSTNNTVNVGDVTINTQATNGQDIANVFGGYLGDLFQANSHFDNGVQI